MRQALTVVLCLPHRVGHAPEAGEHEEHRQLAGVRLPQQEGDNAGQLGHGPCGQGRGAPLGPSEPPAEPPTPCSLDYCRMLFPVPLT